MKTKEIDVRTGEFDIGYKMGVKEASAEIEKLRKQLQQYEKGFKGACPTCEIVGEINLKLEKQLAEANEVIDNCLAVIAHVDPETYNHREASGLISVSMLNYINKYKD